MKAVDPIGMQAFGVRFERDEYSARAANYVLLAAWYIVAVAASRMRGRYS